MSMNITVEGVKEVDTSLLDKRVNDIIEALRKNNFIAYYEGEEDRPNIVTDIAICNCMDVRIGAILDCGGPYSVNALYIDIQGRPCISGWACYTVTNKNDIDNALEENRFSAVINIISGVSRFKDANRYLESAYYYMKDKEEIQKLREDRNYILACQEHDEEIMDMDISSES